MVEDRILETYIHNLPAPLSPLIELYLRDARFLHVALIGQGCKLDPTLVSALMELWRLKTYTSHFLCGKCTSTLADIQL
ncbi:hypothetical protein PVK06_025503 [Gossypium arboreum]|uniref:Uncharacterized protein n=1 Tax=Gossypium arboreum TaxID=29729 RepID=A0ABR0PGR2_GOSAR|nr:hypothetical protein PVK06_025503 [Gossypium arboreum]